MDKYTKKVDKIKLNAYYSINNKLNPLIRDSSQI